MAAPVNSVGKRQHARAKRPVSDTSAENVSRKKPRVNSFDHIEFKSYLKEPQMASLGKIMLVLFVFMSSFHVIHSMNYCCR
jgi:hypothetical protein